jgi:hypothetical protein
MLPAAAEFRTRAFELATRSIIYTYTELHCPDGSKTGNNELYADIYSFYYSFILSQHRTIIVLGIVRMYASTVLDLAKRVERSG